MLCNPFEGLGADHGPILSDTVSLPMKNAKANEAEEVWLRLKMASASNANSASQTCCQCSALDL